MTEDTNVVYVTKQADNWIGSKCVAVMKTVNGVATNTIETLYVVGK